MVEGGQLGIRVGMELKVFQRGDKIDCSEQEILNIFLAAQINIVPTVQLVKAHIGKFVKVPEEKIDKQAELPVSKT